MSRDNNIASVRRIVDEVNNMGNLSIADEIIAPGFVGHGGGSREAKGPEGYKQSAAAYRSAFPDFHMSIEDIVADGEEVAWRFTWQATFTGPMGNISPTGKKVRQQGIAIWRFEDGKVVEAWGYSDSLDMFRQMGVSPAAVQTRG
jgi:predicted ester cyclase